MSNDLMLGPKPMLLTCLLVGMLASSALTQPLQDKEKSGVSATTSTPASVPHTAAVPTIASAVPSGRQATMLRRLWGIDDIHLRSTASGSLIRFSYRVVDADKAKILSDKKATPYLIRTIPPSGHASKWSRILDGVFQQRPICEAWRPRNGSNRHVSGRGTGDREFLSPASAVKR